MLNKWILNCSFIHFHICFSSGESRAGSNSWRTRNASLFSAISDSSASTTPRWDQARSKMQSRNLVLGWPLRRFHLDAVSRACLPTFPWTFWLHDRSNVREISIWGSRSTLRALRVSQLRAFFTTRHHVNSWQNPISVTCTSDSTLPVINQDSRPQVSVGTKNDLKRDTFAVFESSHFVTKERESSHRTDFALTIRLSTSLLHLPPLVNNTSRCWASRSGAILNYLNPKCHFKPGHKIRFSSFILTSVMNMCLCASRVCDTCKYVL